MSPVRAESASGQTAHICVCICTYKRPTLLKRLLTDLATQETAGLFTYSAVVVDNDCERSGQPVVEEFMTCSIIPILYLTEEQQNIALARNKAIANAEGDFIAFIDDDEFPTKDWLLTLLRTCEERKVDGVLGPVKPYFDENAPQWVIKGRFYDRPSYPTGLVIDGKKGRTGNVILKKNLFVGTEPPFRPQFLAGSDQDFFRRMIERGHTFIWCHEALAYEVVPPIRWKRSFMLRRALLRGKSAVEHPACGARDILKSVVAIPLYSVALPFLFVMGHHRFMQVLVKLFDHLGKILALFGLNPIKEPYVTA